MKKDCRFFAAGFLIFMLAFNAFAQSNQQKKDTTPVPYEDDEFPQTMQDLRRFEVITLGSMPFVTLDAAIVYNGYKYFTGKTDTFNPLATADYKPDEMKNIIITSLCVSAGIGLTDFIIRFIKRKNAQKKSQEDNSGIKIQEDPEAVKIPLPQQLPEAAD